MKIIPAIDIMGGKVVRLYRGDPSKSTIYGVDPVATARRWEKEGAHMIHVVDLDAALSSGDNHGVIRQIASSVSIPVQAAGGLRDISMVHGMLEHVERVVVGTLALDADALKDLAHLGDRLVVAIDHMDGYVRTHGWRTGSGITVLEAIRGCTKHGIRQFLVTDVSRDGTMCGPDVAGLAQLCGMAQVIASGGISGISDVKTLAGLNPYGVILGRALYEGRITMREALSC